MNKFAILSEEKLEFRHLSAIPGKRLHKEGPRKCPKSQTNKTQSATANLDTKQKRRIGRLNQQHLNSQTPAIVPPTGQCLRKYDTWLANLKTENQS